MKVKFHFDDVQELQHPQTVVTKVDSWLEVPYEPGWETYIVERNDRIIVEFSYRKDGGLIGWEEGYLPDLIHGIEISEGISYRDVQFYATSWKDAFDVMCKIKSRAARTGLPLEHLIIYRAPRGSIVYNFNGDI